MPIKHIPTGLSLPIPLMDRIEKDRGDIARSKFLLRIIEKHYSGNSNSDQKTAALTAQQQQSQSKAIIEGDTNNDR
jgi:hypothetical protein